MKEDYSFNYFLTELNNNKINFNIKINNNSELSNLRKEYFNEMRNNNLAILKEIELYENKEPFQDLNSLYLNSKYEKKLLEEELSKLNHFQTYEKEEKRLNEKINSLLLRKKVIDYYLKFIIDKYYYLILNTLNDHKDLELKTENSLLLIRKNQDKMKLFKENVIIGYIKMCLYKNKKNNLKFILSLSKKVNHLRLKLIILNDTFKNYLNRNMIQYEDLNILDILNNIYSLKEKMSGYRKLSSNKILIFDYIDEKIMKIEEIIDQINIKKSENLYLSQNEYYKYIFITKIYIHFINISYNQNDSSLSFENEYILFLFNIFKNNIFKTIKEIFIIFSNNSASFDTIEQSDQFKKISDLKRLIYKNNENNLLKSFNLVINNLIKLCDNFKFYLNLHEEHEFGIIILDPLPEKVSLLLKETNDSILIKLYSSVMFYEYLDEIFSILLETFKIEISNFSNLNLFLLLANISIFQIKIKSCFKKKYSKYLNLKIKSILSLYLETKNIEKINQIKLVITNEKFTIVYPSFSIININKKPIFEFNDDNIPFYIKLFSNNLNSQYDFIGNNENEEAVMSKEDFFSLLSYFRNEDSLELLSISTLYKENNGYEDDKNVSSDLVLLLKSKFRENFFNYQPILEMYKEEFNRISKEMYQINKNIFIISSLTFMHIFDYFISFSILYSDIKFDIYQYIFNISDYYIMSIILSFIKNNYNMQLNSSGLQINKYLNTFIYKKGESFDNKSKQRSSFISSLSISINNTINNIDINIEDIKLKRGNKIILAYDNVISLLFYKELFRYISKTYEDIGNLFCDKSNIKTTKTLSDYILYDDYEIFINNTNFHINENDFLVLITAVESINTIIFYLEKTLFITNHMEMQFQKESIIEKIRFYKENIFFTLAKLIYTPILDLIKFESCSKIYQKDIWHVEEHDNYDFSIQSSFIDEILSELMTFIQTVNKVIKNIKSYNNCFNIYFNMFTIEKLKNSILDSISKIKRCNSLGRSLILKDIKFLKSFCEPLLKNEELYKYYESSFNEIEEYINIWYGNDNEIINYIENSRINIKCIKGILMTGPFFISMSKKDKGVLEKQIEDKYIFFIEENFEKFNKL